MPFKHTCDPSNFEKGKRHITSAWMDKNYMEAFRENLILRARDLKKMAKKQHNYNVTISMCIRARVMTLRSLIRGYKEQFG